MDNKTPTKNPQYFFKKIDKIARQATELGEKTEFTERDVALAVELNQQYYDTLQEMEDSPLEIEK